MQRRELLRGVMCGTLAGLPGYTTSVRQFEPQGRVDITDAKEAVVDGDGTTVYIAAETGFVVADVANPATPRILAERRDLLSDHEMGPLRDIQDVSIDENRLLVVGPAHPGGSEAVRAALLYDVSTPTSPGLFAVHYTEFPIHNAEINGGYVYLTSTGEAGNPLVVLRIGDTGLEEVGRWSPVDHSSDWENVPPALVPLHDVTVRDNRAYCSYWDGGTWILDIQDPTAPAYLGQVGGRRPEQLAQIDEEELGIEALELPGNHHSTAVSADGALLAVGKEAWNHNESGPGPGGIELWNVADPASPIFYAEIMAPPTPDATRSGTWSTAHNFDLAAGRLYSAWYQGGVRIHDVTAPSTPIELASWRQPDKTRFWTAQRAATGMIAISMGIDDHEAGLYTFPDGIGQQENPPGNTPTRSSSGGNQQSPKPTTEQPGSTHPSPTTGTQPPRTPTGQTTTPGQGGFGTLIALCGLGGAVSLARLIQRSNHELDTPTARDTESDHP